MTPIRSLLGAVAVVAPLVLTSVSPAGAHIRSTRYGDTTAQVSALHERITVCDGQNDGHNASTDYFDTFDRTGRLYDAYGGSCTSRTLTGSAVVVFRACEPGLGCGAWVSP